MGTEIQRLYAQAKHAREVGQFAEAEQLCLRILAIDVRHAETLHLLGLIGYQTGRYEIAVRMIRRAIAANEGQSFHHSDLGLALQAQGKLDEAVSCYERALDIDPGNAQTHSNLDCARQAQSNPQPAACKVCGGASSFYGVVDFHKSCIEAQGKRLAYSGSPVYYLRCQRCGFLFTTAFDLWDLDAFRKNIYNEDYVIVDPDYVEVRPANNAVAIANLFPDARDSMTILDYGGGSGLLAARLREQGFKADTYDPFSSFNKFPVDRFDLITCFEVMEHVPFPQQTVAEIASLMKKPGAIMFSTLVQPAQIDQIGLNWWYASPRNGHISLYSRASLALLFQPHGMKVGSFSSGLHLAYGEIPAFAAHLTLAQ